ncbi:MAG TPA: hypothetical protein VN628_19260 [Vicinamibacterales bacterium]|nr:hypothetical protein [Vicinamibacterales bacterium]
MAFATAAPAQARTKTVSGTWTLTVEQHFGLKLVLEQKNKTVTGTLSWPHGYPIKLVGTFNNDTLTFAGDSQGEKENFSVHIDSKGSLKADGTMTGTIKALFIDYNDAHEITRRHDQDIPWTAERGEHGIVNFSR